MDIAAAKDGLRMTINIEEAAGKSGWEQRVLMLKELGLLFPDYMYDESGALREWSVNGFEDNHEHRHISHLYPAWPAFETQGNDRMIEACNQAIKNRNVGNEGHDDFSSHGWLHKALVFARLKNSAALYEMIYTILHSEIYYKSMMTDHNTTGRFVYCTDTCLGLVGVINEALLYSDEHVIEVLPALPAKWKKGCINGLRTRCRTEVKELTWDLDEKTVSAVLLPYVDQTVHLRCGVSGSGGQKVLFRKGEVRKVEWEIS